LNVNALFPTDWHYLHTIFGHTQHQNSVFEDFNKSYICQDLASALKSHSEAHGQGALLQSALEFVQQAVDAAQIVYN